MYRDLNDFRIRKEPSPRKRQVTLSPRQQNILISALAFELFLLFVAPICGVSMIDAILAVFRSM